MKILFVAPLERPECTAWLILKAMRNIGLEVECFSYREIAKNESLESMNFKLNEKLSDMDWCDLLFVIKGEGINPETLEGTKPRKVLWWFDFDALYLPPNLINWSSWFNTVFLTCYPWVEKLRNFGINAFFMPQATDTSVYYPVKPVPEYQCDVAFIGSWKPGREELLNELEKNYHVKVFGNGWTNTHPVYLEEFNEVCSSAKVILNITPSDNWQVYPRTFSQRLYMAMSAGAYVATDDIPELNTLLKSVEIYRNINELKEIINFARIREDLRKTIGKMARKEILQKHTYYHRIKEILTCLRLSPSALKSIRA